MFLATAYFPPIEYFLLLDKYENAVIETEETYPKQTFRNRCQIYSEKGLLTLTVPVSRPYGKFSKTKDINIFNETNWQRNHWRAICSAYQNSPYFLYYKDELEFFFTEKVQNLLHLNLEICKKICQLTGITSNISVAEEFIKPGNIEHDYRYRISPKIQANQTRFEHYTQVFSDRHGFIENLSILDVLFNLGLQSREYLRKIGE